MNNTFCTATFGNVVTRVFKDNNPKLAARNSVQSCQYTGSRRVANGANTSVVSLRTSIVRIIVVRTVVEALSNSCVPRVV